MAYRAYSILSIVFIYLSTNAHRTAAMLISANQHRDPIKTIISLITLTTLKIYDSILFLMRKPFIGKHTA